MDERNTYRQRNASAASSSSSSTASSTSTSEVDLDTDLEVGTDVELDTVFMDAESEFDACELGDRCPPLHLQPASLASLNPRYGSPDAIPLRVVGAEQAKATGGQNSASPSLVLRSPARSARRFAGIKLLLSVLKFFRSLWRRLKKAGGGVGRMCRRCPNLMKH